MTNRIPESAKAWFICGRVNRPGFSGAWFPKYAPELNDTEGVWRDLKAHHLAHKTFTVTATLDHQIHAAVESLNQERATDSLVKRRISA